MSRREAVDVEMVNLNQAAYDAVEDFKTIHRCIVGRARRFDERDPQMRITPQFGADGNTIILASLEIDSDYRFLFDTLQDLAGIPTEEARSFRRLSSYSDIPREPVPSIVTTKDTLNAINKLELGRVEDVCANYTSAKMVCGEDKVRSRRGAIGVIRDGHFEYYNSRVSESESPVVSRPGTPMSDGYEGDSEAESPQKAGGAHAPDAHPHTSSSRGRGARLQGSQPSRAARGGAARSFK